MELSFVFATPLVQPSSASLLFALIDALDSVLPTHQPFNTSLTITVVCIRFVIA